eukprot:Clim_evm16s150 gene=Clim_evmTU16s150
MRLGSKWVVQTGQQRYATEVRLPDGQSGLITIALKKERFQFYYTRELRDSVANCRVQITRLLENRGKRTELRTEEATPLMNKLVELLQNHASTYQAMDNTGIPSFPDLDPELLKLSSPQGESLLTIAQDIHLCEQQQSGGIPALRIADDLSTIHFAICDKDKRSHSVTIAYRLQSWSSSTIVAVMGLQIPQFLGLANDQGTITVQSTELAIAAGGNSMGSGHFDFDFGTEQSLSVRWLRRKRVGNVTEYGTPNGGETLMIIPKDGNIPKLQDLTSLARALVHPLAEFWNVMAEIDERCHVEDPRNPDPRDTHRRIRIDVLCSVVVEIDPRMPHEVPKLQLIGNEAKVTRVRAKMNEGLTEWHTPVALPERSDKGSKRAPDLVPRLERLLGETFESRPLVPVSKKRKHDGESDLTVLECHDQDDNDDTAHGAECEICYAEHLDGQLPDEYCGNERCARRFHRACITEWLQGLPSTRIDLDNIIGTCPFCEYPLFIRQQR